MIKIFFLNTKLKKETELEMVLNNYHLSGLEKQNIKNYTTAAIE